MAIAISPQAVDEIRERRKLEERELSTRAREMKERRYHIVITTVVCAVLLWGFVKLGNQYQTTVEIPIDVSDLPEGVAIRTSLPRDIQMILRGEGWQLAALFWRSDLRYQLDLGGIETSRRL